MRKCKILSNGDRFGRLIVLELLESNKVRCLCDCGNNKVILKSNLITGKSNSCGKGQCQSNFKDLSGKLFGYLTVLDIAGSDGNHGIMWNCICTCGNKCVIRGSSLRKGHTKSCGCMSKKLISKALSKEPGLSNVNQLYNTYKNSAKIRGYDWDLSLNDFKYLIKQDCYYCNLPPYQKLIIANLNGERVLTYNGIDRVDNLLGYYIGNVVPACGICNIAKKDLSISEFTNWVIRVHKNLLEKKIINYGE